MHPAARAASEAHLALLSHALVDSSTVASAPGSRDHHLSAATSGNERGALGGSKAILHSTAFCTSGSYTSFCTTESRGPWLAEDNKRLSGHRNSGRAVCRSMRSETRASSHLHEQHGTEKARTSNAPASCSRAFWAICCCFSCMYTTSCCIDAISCCICSTTHINVGEQTGGLGEHEAGLCTEAHLVMLSTQMLPILHWHLHASTLTCRSLQCPLRSLLLHSRCICFRC